MGYDDHRYESARDDALIERVKREHGELCENGKHWPCNKKWHCTIDGKKYCDQCAIEYYEEALKDYFANNDMKVSELRVNDVIEDQTGKAEKVVVSMKYDIFKSDNTVIPVTDIK